MNATKSKTETTDTVWVIVMLLFGLLMTAGNMFCAATAFGQIAWFFLALANFTLLCGVVGYSLADVLMGSDDDSNE